MVKIECYSNVGRVRKENEDTVLALSFQVSGKPYWVGVVCDGIGGGEDGKYASSLVCKSILDAIDSYEVQGDSVLEDLANLVSYTLNKCNSTIYKKYLGSKATVCGTTCSCIILNDKEYITLHVGDSSVFGVRSCKFDKLTVDHTLTREKVLQGLITEEEALTDPSRHTILRAVGINKHLQVDVSDVKEHKYKGYLLTSDGYSEFLTLDRVSEIYNYSLTLEDVACEMLDLGQRDNLSAVWIRIV
jgi:protein phosphatase 2C